MGRKSTKENKSIYQIAREEDGLSRAQASEAMPGLSESQIEKIESGKMVPRPEDILLMADAYKRSDLCNFYCANECPIGKKYVPEVKIKDLPQIVLEVLAALNNLNQKKDRLIEITADGVLEDHELKDFVAIQEQLKKVSVSFDALSLWVDNTVASGKIDEDLLEALQQGDNK